MPVSLQCFECSNYLGDNKCTAFPKNIPYIIRSGEHDHAKSFDGDNGIRFKSWDQKLEEDRKNFNKAR